MIVCFVLIIVNKMGIFFVLLKNSIVIKNKDIEMMCLIFRNIFLIIMYLIFFEIMFFVCLIILYVREMNGINKIG